MSESVARNLSPSATRLLWLWTGIGLRAFGGGQAVQFHAFEALVIARRWLTREAWVESWGLCQVVPGVNVIAFAALTGLRMSGFAGSLASLVGLVLPSGVTTVALAVIYSRVAQVMGVEAALHGVVIAVAAAALVINWRVCEPIVRATRPRGVVITAGALALAPASGALVFTGRLPVFAVLLGGALLTALAWTRSPDNR